MKHVAIILAALMLHGCFDFFKKPEPTIIYRTKYPQIPAIPGSTLMKCNSPQSPTEFFPELKAEGKAAQVERKRLLQFTVELYTNAVLCYGVRVEAEKVQNQISEIYKKADSENGNK